MTQPGDVVGWLANFAVRECRVLLDREGRSRLEDRARKSGVIHGDGDATVPFEVQVGVSTRRSRAAACT